MSVFPLPTTPYLSEEARRRRWTQAMTAQLETARLALVDLPDSEGPEANDPFERRADDVLADQVHEYGARARRAVREALELVHHHDPGKAG